LAPVEECGENTEMSEVPDIATAVDRYRMIRPGSTVLVAFSGGPDSTAMLHALHDRSSDLRVSLHAAHFNHCLRGEASELDAKFAEVFARSLAIPIHTARADHLAGRVRVSEETAREARYAFLRAVAEKIGADCIAVGHTADDRAESVLLNVFRGTGVAGLGSIRPIQGDIIRPLIDATRQDIEAYIAAHGLPYRVDESNADTSYARNWVRLELLPMLESRFNPNVRGALGRLADLAADESDLMEHLAASARLGVQYKGKLDASLMLLLPRAVLRDLLRSEIKHVKRDLTDITYEQIESIISALSEGSDFSITLTSGQVYATRKGDAFRIHGPNRRHIQEPFEIELVVPGSTLIAPTGTRIVAEIVDKPEYKKTSQGIAYLDAASVVGALRVRNARPGDRITPFGMAGTKKLQDVFVDKKIPPRDRDRAVVVEDDEKIVWVVGVVCSEACRVTGNTRQAIVLRAESDQ
jgi:tRNA(Ile)-lysidine synthase